MNKDKFYWRDFFLGLIMLGTIGYCVGMWKTYSYIYDLRGNYEEAIEVAIVWPYTWYQVFFS